MIKNELKSTKNTILSSAKKSRISRLKLRGRGRGLKKPEEILEFRGRGRGPRASLRLRLGGWATMGIEGIDMHFYLGSTRKTLSERRLPITSNGHNVEIRFIFRNQNRIKYINRFLASS
jgi:hypothetical protein